MNVLVLSHLYPTSAQPLSGIFVQKQTEALSRQGLQVTVLNPTPWFPKMLSKFSSRWGKYAQVPHRETHQGMEVVHQKVIDLPGGLLFRYYPETYRLGLAKEMDRLIREKKPDLIHAHVAFPDGAAAVAFGKQYGLPVVVTIHGQDFAHTLNRRGRCARVVKDTLSQASQVILVSEKLRDRYGLREWADDLGKYHVIYNGVDPVVPTRNAPGNPHDRPYPVLLSVGFLRKPKGHLYVIEALAQATHLLETYPDLSYRIVGEGAERPTLEARVQELGLQKHVEFLGSMPHAEAMVEMARCDLFVLPSWDEAFGVVYLEALAQGKPVIATKGEGVAPLLEREGVGITVRPRDVKDIRRAMEKLIQKPLLARKMGRKGKALVQAQFTWDHNAHQTIRVYRAALAKRSM